MFTLLVVAPAMDILYWWGCCKLLPEVPDTTTGEAEDTRPASRLPRWRLLPCSIRGWLTDTDTPALPRLVMLGSSDADGCRRVVVLLELLWCWRAPGVMLCDWALLLLLCWTCCALLLVLCWCCKVCGVGARHTTTVVLPALLFIPLQLTTTPVPLTTTLPLRHQA